MRETIDFTGFLKSGKRNAISKSELMNLMGYKNERRLRADIAKARRTGQLICSSNDRRHGGYYLPENREELASFVRALENHARHTFLAIKTARKALEQMDGQVELEDVLDEWQD